MNAALRPKHDPSVELARIIGCFIVVGVHTCLSPITSSGISKGRILVSCLFADGVGIFWIIAGFFFFRSKNYSSKYRQVIKRILIPLLTTGCLYFYLFDFFTSEATLLESIAHPFKDYRELFWKLVSWHNPFSHAGHLWYLFTYIGVTLFYPILKPFVDTLDESPSLTKRFLVVSLSLLVVNDITGNSLFSFSHGGLTSIVPASLLMVYGHILYHHSERIDKCPRILFLIIFLLSNIIRLIIQYNHMSLDNSYNHILFWYTSLGVLSAFNVISFCLSLKDALLITKYSGFICKLAKLTFGIYLLHILVRDVLRSTMLIDILQSKTSSLLGYGFAFDLAYTMIASTIIFTVAAGIILIWQSSRNLLVSPLKAYLKSS